MTDMEHESPDYDPLEGPFQNDASFRRLLKNRTFNDYLNTFLSLPVFAVRVLYRRDNDTFELEQDLPRTHHHLIKEHVLTWVREKRAPMFLKTSICNEYRFCAALLKLPVCLNIEEYDDNELKKFHKKYLAKVIDMQRLKNYMQGSYGENLINFWLDAERFRRQVTPQCRRFVLKEVYSKYLCQGSVYELSQSVRENINNNLKTLWEQKAKVGVSYIEGNVLVAAQQIVLNSLQSYWLPKYVYHRMKRRGLIKLRWERLLGKNGKGGGKKPKLLELVAALKKKTGDGVSDGENRDEKKDGKGEEEMSEEAKKRLAIDINWKIERSNSGGASPAPKTPTKDANGTSSPSRTKRKSKGRRSRRSSLTEGSNGKESGKESREYSRNGRRSSVTLRKPSDAKGTRSGSISDDPTTATTTHIPSESEGTKSEPEPTSKDSSKIKRKDSIPEDSVPEDGSRLISTPQPAPKTPSSEMLAKCKSSEFSADTVTSKSKLVKRRRSLSESDKGKGLGTRESRPIGEKTSMWSRIVKRQNNNMSETADEDDDVAVTSLSNSNMITLETPTITESYRKDESLFAPMFPPILASDVRESRRKRRKQTLFESLQENPEENYEADNEDNRGEGEDLHLPLIKTLEGASESFIAPMLQMTTRSVMGVQQPYSKSFISKNMLGVVADDVTFHILVAALTTDQVAGQPLLNYFKDTNKKEAESNLKFWTASNDILTDSRCNDPLIRQKQYHTLIHLHLSQFSGSHLSLSLQEREELCELLPRDVAVTRLMEATNHVAVKLMPEWDEFLKHDRKTFLKSATNRRQKISVWNGSLLPHLSPMSANTGQRSSLDNNNSNHDNIYDNMTDGEYDGTFPENLAPVQQRETDAAAFNSRRMWRAMELAIAICKPKHTEQIADVKENEKWTTDDDEESPDSDDDNIGRHRDERVAGSLAINSLEYLQQKQQRLKKLEELFNKRHQSIAHEYMGVNLLKHIGENGEGVASQDEDMKPAFMESARRETVSSVRPPRPRCFQDLLTDTIQFEHFKRFLSKEKEETPLLFWQAVESMRTTSRSAKARQGRTHGIVKRYFGASSNHGKDLKCNADIIKEIPYMEKVTPAMLVSAQACVSKTMEETWFAKYLLTFQDQGGATGVTILPIYGQQNTTNETVRSVKNKTRGLWRMFTRNVISFRRGIMTNETLVGFREFLELQHQQNVEAAGANNLTENGGPPKVVINNKLIHTEKLLADLNFWSEVERYKDFADAVVLCAKLGNYTKDDELIVVKKAKTIVDCFIDSQIPPKVQINISNDLAENVIQLVQNGIIERGLFHEAALSTFSTLIFFWKKFCLHRFLPEEKKPQLARKLLKNDRSAQILAKQRQLRANKAKRVALSLEDDCTKLMFSLQLGLRLGVQKSLVKSRRNLSECDDSRRDSVGFMESEDSPVGNAKHPVVVSQVN